MNKIMQIVYDSIPMCCYVKHDNNKLLLSVHKDSLYIDSLKERIDETIKTVDSYLERKQINHQKTYLHDGGDIIISYEVM